jgi:hypothetical protein
MTDSIIQIKRSSNTATPTSLANGELAYSYASNNLFIGMPGTGVIKIGGASDVHKLDHADGVLTVSSAVVTNASGFVDNFKTLNLTSQGTQTANVINAQDITVSNTLAVDGNIILRGSSLTLGDGGDTISLGATVNSSIIPTTGNTFTLGDTTNRYLQVFANQMTVAADPISPFQVSTKQYVDNVADQLNGNTIIVGVPTDGAWSNNKASAGEGGVVDIVYTDKIADAIDKLNEATYNIYQNTYVRDVTFTVSSGAAGGTPLNTTLNIVTTGNPNLYDIDWGDGSWSNNTSDSTPSHQYTDNTNSPFDIVVTAKNTNAKGSGNTATVSTADAVILYTSDPISAFQMYDAASGGNVITEANINQTVYLDSNTTNANDVVATFFVNWGDSSSQSISNTSVAGGPQGTRLTKTYTAGTGVGSNTISYSINTHATADPSVIPHTATTTLKIFDTAIAAPAGLVSKNIQFVSGSQGSNPKVAHGFVDASGGTTALVVGATPTRRYTGSGSVNTTGTANSSLTYNADGGTLSAYIDGGASGAVVFDSSDNSGTVTNLIVAEEDYYNYNGSGSSISASNRTFAPGLYKGFRARINKGSHSTGAHSYKLVHSVTGNTAQIDFITDNLTGTPVLAFNGTTVTQNTAGTLAYVSGIPYYTNDAILDVAGVLVANVAGQTYRNTTSFLTVQNGTNTESDSGSAINTQTRNYQQILPSSTLNSNNPIANTGVGANVACETFQINVSGGGRCVEGIAMYGKNVNGNGSTLQYANTQIQSQNGNSSGVNENTIVVSDSLGGTYNDDGKRIVTGFAGATPAFSSSTNYYTGAAWTGSQTIAGTDEAVTRFGTIKHFTTDLSSGYLPVGPDLNTSRSGRQYFRFAFRRSVMANFTITMSGRVSSFHIAAPATSIDSTSSVNGWLNAGAVYAGAGTPGANVAAGGNGDDGCAQTAGDTIVDGTTYSSRSFTLTLGDQNASSSFGNQILVSIGLDPGDSITGLSIA